MHERYEELGKLRGMRAWVEARDAKTGESLWRVQVYDIRYRARELVEAARSTGKRVVPHFLGSAPGQAASLHFAAGCSDGLVEMDINRNPLRAELFDKPFEVVDGMISIPDKPGLGWHLSH